MDTPASTRAADAAPREGRVAELLDAFAGDRAALDDLLPVVYEELRRVAHHELRRERADHTLTTTALVHEAYLRLMSQTPATQSARARFFAVAVTAMRRVLIEYARQRHALKRGGGQAPITLDELDVAAEESSEAILALDEALARLSALSPRLAHVVECRYFGGLTEDETAEVLGITPRTVRRDWVKAKGWLYEELNDRNR